ncbi:hypothetical protein FGRMN_5012 [Fusarium graminum]|nr:hypothetical protein FGRMN_5012 [Fusarium graminum]
MSFPTKTESLFWRFARDPNDGRDEHHCDVAMTMIDSDDSSLYENDRLDLLLSIVSENETSTLEQYLIVAPWAVPSKPLWVEESGTSGLDDEIFFRATYHGYLNTLRMLLATWAGPHLIKKIIDSGVDIHGKVVKGHCMDDGPEIRVSALYSACTNAIIDAVETLIECRGLNVDAGEMVRSQDSRGCVALHWATTLSEMEDSHGLELNIVNITGIVELSLEVDPSTTNAQDHQGNTPLHHASRKLSQNKNCTAIFETLFRRGADGTLRNNKKETPLHTMLSYDLTSIIDPDEVNTAALSAFLLHGMKVKDSDIDENAPLHIVAWKVQHFRTVSFLLEQGGACALYFRNAQQDTPAHIAARADY